jgi:hypothetical protein
MLFKYIIIYINVNIYHSVVHHVRILDRNLSGTRTQLLFHLIGMTRGLEGRRGYRSFGGREAREVGMFGRSENFVRLRKSGGLGGPGVW